ncbi:MAG: SpoIID/LytB domain-containing protein [Candidatus Limiplasma sp.]|nr:SpoIID/LytB domain-containing protein [Candidatus Limiplasma sp.]
MKKTAWLALIMASMLVLSGCAVSAEPAPGPTPTGAKPKVQVNWPKDRLETGENGVPVLDVYVVDDEQVERVDVETYVQGVLAGEMKNDWPLEALKAQAILARTFVLKFLSDKQSKYEGADISTDIEEAQAYDASAVNDRIREAVSETEGMVLSAGGELPYAWFHAHSGGLTALAREGLGWDKDEPPYTQVVPGNEPETAQGDKDAQMLKEAQHWQASFPYEEVEAACQTLGVDVSLEDGAKLTIEERGDSGRAVRIGLNGQSVDASDLRIALGSTKMRSTLITSLRAQEGKLVMAGTGYGHGVGMSQWGAYGMAQAGSTAEQIVTYYFRDVTVEKIW